MIENGVFEMFGTQVSTATADAVALQESLDSSIETADAIDAHLGRGVVHPQIDQLTSSASQLSRALGSASSLDQVMSHARRAQDDVVQGAQALGNRFQEAKDKGANHPTNREGGAGWGGGGA